MKVMGLNLGAPLPVEMRRFGQNKGVREETQIVREAQMVLTHLAVVTAASMKLVSEQSAQSTATKIWPITYVCWLPCVATLFTQSECISRIQFQHHTKAFCMQPRKSFFAKWHVASQHSH